MQKTFKKGGPKVIISKHKLVTIDTGKESINFYFGNPSFVEAEKEWMGRFLWAEYCEYMQDQVKEYVFSNI